MHVAFVSLCEKKAARRTALVLDAYAPRTGARTWITPITAEGLLAIRGELRRTASRGTAVACFINEGRSNMRLAWTVGRRTAFSENGRVAVATKLREQHRPQVPQPVRLAALLAACGGLAHDLGKYGGSFAAKLDADGPVADPVRHEWLSMHVLVQARAGREWEQAWKVPLLRMSEYAASHLSEGVTNARTAMDYLVFTHHRLPSDDLRTAIGDGNYTSNSEGVSRFRGPVGAPPPALWRKLQHLQERLDRLSQGQSDPVFWRAVATLARAALVLADHSVSSQVIPEAERLQRKGRHGLVYANTARVRGRRFKNQLLDWHLQAVSKHAAELVYAMHSLQLAGLDGAALASVRQPSEGRFAWQNTAAGAVSGIPADHGVLVLNMAATGCGKTRANARIATELRKDGPPRLSYALNLVSLTRQTADAFASQLGLTPSDFACVVGSKGLLGRPGADDDENEPQDDFDTAAQESSEPIAWLEPFLQRRPQYRALLHAPVAVCTVDFLVAGGEPQRQAIHALAMLRLATSDLVLDEIDSYDPKPLAAVLRMVTCAAMWGRHVIAASATLPAPVAKALWQAYELGTRMRQALTGQGSWSQVIVDDTSRPRILACTSSVEFEAAHRTHTAAVAAGIGRRRYRAVELQDIPEAEDPRVRFACAVQEAAMRLHERQRQVFDFPGGPHAFSIGLVRVANIRTAIHVARHLELTPNVRVCCYHSQLGAMQRYHVERSLDAALTRKSGHAGYEHSAPIMQAVEQAQQRGDGQTIFIVVATPVEEIGRDHDFDWAVVEPSSMHSLVQVCGRVNRHRLVTVDQPNVALLRFNLRHLTGKPAAFQWPGLERSDAPYEHDLAKLLDFAALDECGQLDARARFAPQRHCFAALDDYELHRQLSAALERFLRCDSPDWIRASTYTDVPLRERTTDSQVWTMDATGSHLQLCRDGDRLTFMQRDLARSILRSPRDWLVLSSDEARLLAAKLGLTEQDAFKVEIGTYRKGSAMELRPVQDQSFGYYFD